MITIERAGTIVRLKADSKRGWTTSHTFDTDNELYAILLTERLQQALWDELQAIREKAYKNGWDDKTKRKQKKEWFPGGFKY